MVSLNSQEKRFSMNELSVLEKEISHESKRLKPSSPRIGIEFLPEHKLPRKIFLGVITGMAALVLGFILFSTQYLPPLNEIENPQSTLSTQVLSADGIVLDNFFARENRVNIHLNEVSPHVINALVATEDARFYDHSGVDYWSIPALVKRNLSGTTSGGSTITMQLARNLFNAVSRERTVFRKVKEIIVSAILEKKYTKQEIMEAYLNTVNIFGNAYGVEMAAKRLFGKTALELSIEESALVVGMLKGQGVYDPIRKKERSKERRNVVINLMVKHGFLNPAEVDVDSIKQLPVVTVAQGQMHYQGTAPYFRQIVKEFVKDWAEKNPKPDGSKYNLYADGLKVFTSLDSRMQVHAESAVREHLTKLQQDFDEHIDGQEPYKYDPKILEDLTIQSPRYRRAMKAGKSEKEIKEEFDKPVEMTLFSWNGEIDTTLSPLDSIKYMCRYLETGFVSIDPRNGQVKAWVGGIDYRYFQYDHVKTGKRQVGSTFKPFVYGAAIEAGLSPCTEELNQPWTFPDTDGKGTPWTPKNANGKFGGKMTLRTALATSTNLVTARLMDRVRPENVVRFARRVGIQSPLEAVYALCLGTADLSVLELTGAYSTFANQGISNDPIFVTRIEDRKGNVLVEFSPNSKEGMNARDAYGVLELLKGTVDEAAGTAHALRTEYNFTQEIGAKTGTTQNHADGWFVAVTPEMVSGVWVGCADRRMRFRDIKNGQGANMAMPIWANFIQKVDDDPNLKLEKARFRRPRGYGANFDCLNEGDEDGKELLVQDKNLPQSSDDLNSFD